MSNWLDSTRILKCACDRKERRTQEPKVKSSTNTQEALQNLDDWTQSISPHVCRSQEPQVRPFRNAQGGLQHAANGLFKSRPLWLEVPTRNATWHKKISQRCLILCPLENTSTPLQWSFAIERPTQLANGRWRNKKIRRCLVLRNSFRDRKSRCTINHANKANKNLTSIVCIFVCYPPQSYIRARR